MKKGFTLVLLFFSFSLFGAKTEILFLAQDAGETNAFIPLMRLLEEKEVPFDALVGGVAEEIILKEPSLKGHAISFAAYGVQVDKNWPRDKKAEAAVIARIQEAFSPRVVLSGVAFDLQGQIMEALQNKGVECLAYWDNFTDEGDNPYFKTARRVQAYASTLLLPSEALYRVPFFQTRERTVVGHPALDLWRCLVPSEELKQTLSLSKKVISYVGGYGKDYEEGFSLFVQSLKKGHFEDFQILVLPHPKTDGSFEKKMIQEKSLPSDIRILTGYSTPSIAALSDLILCHQSTVGVQALAIPKPVLFLIPESQKYQNPLLEKGLVKRLGEKDDLEKEVRQALSGQVVDIYKAMGIPENGVQHLYEEISR